MDSVSPHTYRSRHRHTPYDCNLDNAYYLTIRLHTPGFPPTVSAEVSAGAYHTIHDGDHILAEYSPFLHVLNALTASASTVNITCCPTPGLPELARCHRPLTIGHALTTVSCRTGTLGMARPVR